MRQRRIKFVWGTKEALPARWHLGLFGVFDREGKHSDGLAISGRGALLWGGAMAVAAYVAAATALFYIWQRNPYSILSYADALGYPVRRTQIRDKQGQAYLNQGSDLFRQRKYFDARTLLLAGLARHPYDFRARLTLAQFYSMANQRPAAVRVLEEGLTAEYPGRAYLDALFGAAEQGEDFGRVIRWCDRYLPLVAGDSHASDRRWLRLRKFVALTGAGRHQEALDFARAEEQGSIAWEHRVLALLALGRLEQATALLAQWRDQPIADIPTITRLEVRTFREAKRFPEMDRALVALRALTPAQPAPLVYATVQRAMAGREADAGAALDDYLFRFGGSVGNILLVADPLAEVGQLGLVEQCARAAKERGYPPDRFQVLLIQTHLQRGEWAAASQLLAAMRPVDASAAAASARLWREWVTRLLDAVTNPADSAQVALVEFLRDRPWPIALFQRTSDALVTAGRLETARDVLASAQRAFPTSVSLQERDRKVAAALAAHAGAIAAGVVTTAPVWTEAAFFKRLDGALATHQWDDVEEMLRAAQGLQPEPAWLAARDTAIHGAKVRLSHARNDRPAMLAAARLFVGNNERHGTELLGIAREFFDTGDKDAAIALAKEVQRGVPGHVYAKRLLAEWQPPAPK